MHKLGEGVTETLEIMPRQWKVIQHVREVAAPASGWRGADGGSHLVSACGKAGKAPILAPVARAYGRGRAMRAWIDRTNDGLSGMPADGIRSAAKKRGDLGSPAGPASRSSSDGDTFRAKLR